MHTGWTATASRALAELAAGFWGAEVAEHIADSGNSVWRLERNGVPGVLRLSDPAYRTIRDCRSEIRYVNHLTQNGIQVAGPVLSDTGEFVHAVSVDGETMLASVFTWAEGERVHSRSPLWNDSLFLEWGRTLGRIHRASRTFHPSPTDRRWTWSDEPLMADAERLIPGDDGRSHRELRTVFAMLGELPVDSGNFGMTHGDFAPQNFHRHPERGITAFDFGNCCYHWFISDLAISFSSLRNLPDRERYRGLILEGYGEQVPIDPVLFESIDLFLRLRTLYVYLSRLMKFGERPDPEQSEILSRLRRNVHDHPAW